MVLHRLTCLKYLYVLKWESRFNLGLNTAKVTNYVNFCLTRQSTCKTSFHFCL